MGESKHPPEGPPTRRTVLIRTGSPLPVVQLRAPRHLLGVGRPPGTRPLSTPGSPDNGALPRPGTSEIDVPDGPNGESGNARCLPISGGLSGAEAPS